jgi:hypothetical protein
MPYYSEVDKAIEIINPIYLEGKVIDIGSGGHKSVSWAISVDGRDIEGVDLVLRQEHDIYRLSEFSQLKEANTLISSHLLEHLRNPTEAIENWSALIKMNGYLILYLPDRRGYSNEGNMEHMFDWDMDSFLFYFKRCFCGEGRNYKGDNFKPIFRLVENQLDMRPDCYSFLVIAQKL